MTKKIPGPDKALWRYGIISPLLHKSDDDPSLAHMLRKLSQKEFLRPDGTRVRLSGETLRKWLYRYRHGGLEALNDQVRADKGRRQIPAPLTDAMAKLRKQHPNWTVAKILEKLLHHRLWNGRRPSRSTLYRFAKNHLPKPGPSTPVCRPFAFTAFGQLWIADFMHGPKIRHGRRLKKALLHAIIDDASRYVVTARFYWTETVETLLTEMMIAIRRLGIPQRFYTDNGPCYASGHLKMVCARLGIHLVHTPPYRPQGRGKIERFFKTVRDQFLGELTASTLDQLNDDLQNYLAEYHQRRHSSLKISPLQKRLSIGNVLRPMPEVADIRTLFAMQRRCRVYNDGTIRLRKKRFEVPGALPGSTIDVFYLPWDPTWVCYGNDRLHARLVDQHANAHRFQHPNRKGE